MNNYKILTSILLVLSVCSIYSQNVDFDEYKKRIEKEYDNYSTSESYKYNQYKDSINIEFASYLSNRWEEFNIYVGVKPDEEPKPITIPEIETHIIPQDELDLEIEIEDLIDFEDIIEEEPSEMEDVPIIAPSIEKPDLLVDFYNAEIAFSKEDAFFNLRLANISEKEVAKLWSTFAESYNPDIIYQIQDVKQDRHLNDYAVYLLISKMANQLLPNKPDEQIVYTVFLLNQLGFKAKIAKYDNELISLISIKQQVYIRSYLIFGTDPNERFYIFSSNPNEILDCASIYTYKELMGICDKEIDLNFYNPLILGNNAELIEIKAEEFGDFQLSICIDEIDFYKNYPHTVMQVYANAELNDDINDDLLGPLKYQIKDKSELEAVNYLLHFVHTCRAYMTDDEQFGYEKPMFSVETLYYPYSDCEDNSIFFSYLVRKLLGLDVVLLDYPGHIATAVKFSGDVNGSFIQLKDGKYVVCDPTYFGSNVGMTMPKYKNEKLSAIELRKLDRY